MEKNFKVIETNQRELRSGRTDLVKTFAFDIFKDVSWVFPFLGLDTQKVTQLNSQVALKTSPAPTPLLPPDMVEIIPTKTEVLEQLNAQSEKSYYQGEIPQKGNPIEVLFVGDTYVEGEDLLGKMILAMKLLPEQFARLPQTDEKLAIEKVIVEKRPKFVVTLGANSSALLLQKKEKLSTIHGQFYKRSLELSSGEQIVFDVVPLFHPELLQVNPSMKKTAWQDMQKIMQALGKV